MPTSLVRRNTNSLFSAKGLQGDTPDTVGRITSAVPGTMAPKGPINTLGSRAPTSSRSTFETQYVASVTTMSIRSPWGAFLKRSRAPDSSKAFVVLPHTTLTADSVETGSRPAQVPPTRVTGTYLFWVVVTVTHTTS